MKKLRLLIISILILSTFLTACVQSETPVGPNGPSGPTKPTKPETNYTQTAIVKNGVSDYKVVIPEDADSYLSFAGNELVNFVYESTGVKLEIVNDRGLTYDKDSKYLSIGNNKYYQSAEFGYNLNKLGYSDYYLQTKGNSLFMVGGNRYGTLYAVYEILERLVDLEIYADDEIFVKKETELYLPELNLLVEPQFDVRLGSRALTWTDNSYERRMKMVSMNMAIMDTGGKNHNSFGIMPKEKYWDEHRNWYSTDGEQLCYSQEDMLDEMCENLKNYILNDTSDAEIIIIGEQDVGTWCKCDECSASKTKYGSDSAVYVQAINYVARKMKAWQEEVLPDHRPMTYMLFAYYLPECPPMHFNTEKGDWEEPVDDTVICDDNVAVWYAPIYTNYTYRFIDPENKFVADYMRGWAKVCKNFYMWDYANNYNCYMIGSNSFNVFQDNIKFAVECGVQFYFTQASHDSRQPVFEELREYLTANLMWDCNLDYAYYIDDFFNNFYKDSAVAMKKYFDSFRDYYSYLEQTQKLAGGIFTNLRKAEFWPRNLLDKWMGYIDEAYESIEHLKTKDVALYNKLHDRINKESLSIRFLLIDLHGGTYNDAELLEMKYAFKDDATKLKIGNVRESTSITELYKEWGIK